MEIKSTFIHQGHPVPFVYRDIDSSDELKGEKIKAVQAYCFYGDKLIVVYAEKKGTWGPPVGGVEPGETIEEAIAREVFEETNMRVLKQRIIGYIDSKDIKRYFDWGRNGEHELERALILKETL